MKYLVSKTKAVNLANVSEIYISNNYLMLTTSGGSYCRDISFVYGTPEELSALFDAILTFISDDFVSGAGSKVFNCDEFLKTL